MATPTATHGPMVWPVNQPEVPPLVAFGYFTLISILACLLVLRGRTLWLKFDFIRCLVFIILLDGYLFVYFVGILVLGIGTSAFHKIGAASSAVCELAICKVLITIFLMERVYLVHSISAQGRPSRWKNRWYLPGCGFLVLWCAEAGILIAGRVHEIRQSDGACQIGLRLYSTMTLVVIDATTNIFLTAAFIVPIYRSKFPRARRLAHRSCIASVAALASTVTNVVVIAALHGREIAWVCLGLCSIDTIIFFITSPSQEDIDTAAVQSRTILSRRSLGTGSEEDPRGPFRTFLSRGQKSSSSNGVHVCSEVMKSVDDSMSRIDYPLGTIPVVIDAPDLLNRIETVDLKKDESAMAIEVEFPSQGVEPRISSERSEATAIEISLLENGNSGNEEIKA
ncbi:BQ2448_4565 [Microbotryum intermedium]|uniref:BQ2448_4565 protein n=1 Tax=Microbotryum intermedium TaxID=269621 RepID=A0A238FIA0_9BASI|nr:BQ2448_4565 [Microbotryum intermedium]